MKTCPKCNTPNQDEFMFCENCGTNLQGEGVIQSSSNTPPVTQVPPDVAPSNTAPGNPIPSNPAPSNPAPSNASPKKSSPIVKIVLACVTLGVLYFIISSIIVSSNPTYKLLKGLSKLPMMDKSTINMDVNVGYDGDFDEGEILNDFTFKTILATDLNNLLAESSIDILYKNKSVTKVLGGINNEDVYVDLQNLYKENKFYQELDGLIPDYQDYVNDIKIVKKAFNDISLKIDTKKYADIVNDVLGKDIKRSGSKIIVTLDSKTSVELMEEILDEAVDDEKLMKSVRTNAINFLEKILKEKKKLEIIDEDDLEEALEALEDEDDFEDAYQDFIEGALSSLQYSADDIDEMEEIELTFSFGLFNTITGIDYTIDIDDDGEAFEIKVKTNIKKGAKFTKYNKKNEIEIKELITDPDEMEEISEVVIENLVKAIEKHEELAEEIEDRSGMDIDEALELVIGNMF